MYVIYIYLPLESLYYKKPYQNYESAVIFLIAKFIVIKRLRRISEMLLLPPWG
jgi:hypothetical protein